MTLDTDLSRKPYFDDFDQTKNFYRVLYKPAVAVQARELNQMQTIMQDQIDKFGRFVFKDGSVVEGCAFSFDNNYAYVKINDNFANNSAISNIASFQSTIVTNSNGLKATVVNTVGGYQSQAPDLNTLYIKYLNSATYPNGSIQSVFSNNDVLALTTTSNVAIGNVTVSPVTNSTGLGYAFSTTEGVIFKKGFFIRVAPQTLVVSKYSNVPDAISVGFDAAETIATSNIDTTLLDNAAGSPNYDAPGADRFVLTPTLITRNSADTANSTTFFSLCDFKNGLPVSIKSDPQLAALGKETARRTYETNGDYVVNPFLLNVQTKYNNSVANSTYLNLVSSSGLGYVKGYRVEFINNNTVDLRKGTDIESVSAQNVSSNFGYYFNVNEFSGDFGNSNLSQIELHNVAKTSITGRTFLSTSYSSTTKIGTAYVRGVVYDSAASGTTPTYRLYLFGIQMLPGFNITQVRSAIRYNSSLQSVADIVLSYDANLGNIAKLQDSANEIMLHPFGQKAISPGGFTNEQFVYRDSNTTSFNLSGIATISLPAASGTGSESFYYTGTYSPSTEATFLVIPTVNGYFNKTGANVYVNTTSTTVTGFGTTFLTDYNVGDFIYTNSNIRRVTNIANNTVMVVDSAFGSASNTSHQKIFPAGVPVNFSGVSTRTISATSGTVTVTLNETPNAAFNATMYYDVLRSSTTSIKKIINKSTWVKIQANTNAGGATGPWCLGVPDVLNLNHVYVGSNTYANSNPDQVASFSIDNGQRDSYYGLAYISSSVPVSNNATILVSVDNFTYNDSQGRGYFNANSYPIDDANTANTNAIQTYQIPLYKSQSTGNISDLRDVIDFRPYANATANATANVIASATINPANTLSFYIPATGSYLPSPDTNYQASIQHYLPRQDRIALTTSGEILITEGAASNNPSPPAEIPGTMTIGIASVPAYPSLTPADAAKYNRYDYAVSISVQQTKRYTMADIGKIDNRISRLEYYTSLSLLEQSASSLLVRSGTTGQNRFKNGILVDPFKDHSIGNTNDSTYRIAIDSARKEARPYSKIVRVGMYFDPVASTNAVKTGEIVTLPYTSSVAQSQVYASKYRNCIEGNVYNFRGTITLDPPGTVNPDLTITPDVVSNLDTSANWINAAKYISTAWGTQWGSWTDGPKTVAGQNSSTYLTGQSTNADGSIVQNYQTAVATTTSEQISRIGQQLTSQPSTSTVNLGQYVTDISILPYMKAASILFVAKGMKPSTTLYAYFNSVPVSNRCMPVTPYTGVVSIVAGIATSTNGKPVYYDSKNNAYEYVATNWGSALQADSTGTVYGIFSVPDATFHTGEIEFKLTDISNLTQGENAVTTQSTATYYASSLSVQKSNAVLQVRSSTINTQEVIQNSVVQQTTVTYQDFSQYIPAPVSPPAPWGGDGGYSNDGQGDGDSV
jgi:hypothetical protein